jgi:anthranilate synthase/indole-3-glycerol phosphate synthase/phosphoribosylanthranilate isomerase
MAAAAAVAGEAIPLVKICGTQDADSAVIATKAGADFIGMIFVPKSK